MSKNQEYVKQYAEYAMEQMRRYGIPASVTLAQGICESASGQSELSRKGNNHFGIKATSGWVQNGGKYLVYTDDRPNEKFCQYASVGDSYEHHSQFLKGNKRYSSLFKLSPDDYRGWTNGLQNSGYASNKKYASSLQSIIEKNNLQKYDQMVMQEMKAQGKTFGTETNPRHKTDQNASVTVPNVSDELKYSYPLKRNEFMLVTSPFGTRKDPSIQVLHKCTKVLIYEPNMTMFWQRKTRARLQKSTTTQIPQVDCLSPSSTTETMAASTNALTCT